VGQLIATSVGSGGREVDSSLHIASARARRKVVVSEIEDVAVVPRTRLPLDLLSCDTMLTCEPLGIA
jgi:hypothetical protein